MSSSNSYSISALEALLFQYGEPISKKKAATLLSVSEEECERLVNEYAESLRREERGLTLLIDRDIIQLMTKPEFKDVLESVIHDEFKEELTPAALETLSIIAYLGPVPRATIDYIRGVNSSFIVRNLLVRGLVERNQDENRKHAYEYKITFDFLKHLGISRVEELPEFDEFKDILLRYESQNEKDNAGDGSDSDGASPKGETQTEESV